MEAVILVGIQASGSSTFYAQRFADTHVRISRDLLGTRARERQLLEECLGGATVRGGQHQRAGGGARAIHRAGAGGGDRVADGSARIRAQPSHATGWREGRAVIPIPGIWHLQSELRMEEGFDALYVDDAYPRQRVRRRAPHRGYPRRRNEHHRPS